MTPTVASGRSVQQTSGHGTVPDLVILSPLTTPAAQRRRFRLTTARLVPFWWWLMWFYSGWVALVWVGGYWETITEHWPIAVAMAAGSYVAGSTPMGGGTIGFPILVLLLNEPASLGRGFSFCIQAIGMVSAGFFILSSRVPLAGRVLGWSMAGSTLTVPLVLTYVTPLVSDVTVKLVFACIWAAFGLMTLVKIRDLVKAHHAPTLDHRLDAALGLLAGLTGGVAAGLTGVGIDMVLYTVLVLIYRVDLRMAIATSVVAMAYNSVVGVVASAWLGTLNEEIFFHWLAAAPIVAIGAPIGVLVMRVVPRDFTLVVVAVLCLGQFAWACTRERAALGLGGVAGAIATVLALNLGFHFMYRWGRRLVPEHAPARPPHSPGAVA